MSYYNFQQPFSGVVRHLIIINVLMFFGTLLLMGEPEAYLSVDTGQIRYDRLGRILFAGFMPGSEYFQPFQIATHMFMHDNLPHLLFNMLAIYFFGPMVEMVWGHRRFWFYYLTCGVGGYLLYMGIEWYQLQSAGQDPTLRNGAMLGASGAVFGILVAYAFHFPNHVLRLLFPPIEMKAKYFVPLIALLELFYGVQTRFDTGIAHFGHLGGALAGLIVIGFWYKFKYR